MLSMEVSRGTRAGAAGEAGGTGTAAGGGGSAAGGGGRGASMARSAGPGPWPGPLAAANDVKWKLLMTVVVRVEKDTLATLATPWWCTSWCRWCSCWCCW